MSVKSAQHVAKVVSDPTNLRPTINSRDKFTGQWTNTQYSQRRLRSVSGAEKGKLVFVPQTPDRQDKKHGDDNERRNPSPQEAARQDKQFCGELPLRKEDNRRNVKKKFEKK